MTKYLRCLKNALIHSPCKDTRSAGNCSSRLYQILLCRGNIRAGFNPSLKLKFTFNAQSVSKNGREKWFRGILPRQLLACKIPHCIKIAPVEHLSSSHRFVWFPSSKMISFPCRIFSIFHRVLFFIIFSHSYV